MCEIEFCPCILCMEGVQEEKTERKKGYFSFCRDGRLKCEKCMKLPANQVSCAIVFPFFNILLQILKLCTT